MRHLTTALMLTLSVGTLVCEAQQPDLELKRSVVTAEAERAKGSELRPNLEVITEKIKRGNWQEASHELDALCEKYEAQFDRQKRQYSFATRRDFDRYVKGSAAKAEWIDDGYQTCLQERAYIAVERGSNSDAIAILDRTLVVAPFAVPALVELGAIHHRAGHLAEAMTNYREGESIARSHVSQRPFLAVTLRGAGSTLIDMNRFEEAQRMLEESLALDPDNAVAKHELKYIQQRQAGGRVQH